MQLPRTALLVIPLCVTAMLLSGCEQQQPLVYVLEGPQDVTLTASQPAPVISGMITPGQTFLRSGHRIPPIFGG